MEDRLITPHFKLSEFACKDGTPYPVEWVDERLVPLCQIDEVIRDYLGGHSMTILCGYRTPGYNEKLRQRGLQGESGQTGLLNTANTWKVVRTTSSFSVLLSRTCTRPSSICTPQARFRCSGV